MTGITSRARLLQTDNKKITAIKGMMAVRDFAVNALAYMAQDAELFCSASYVKLRFE